MELVLGVHVRVLYQSVIHCTSFLHAALLFPLMNETENTTNLESSLQSSTEKSLIMTILSIEMVLGITGNSLVLTVKAMCKAHFQCVHWIPLVSLTLSDLCCSALIISGSLFAMVTEGQQSPWCEVVSLLKFAFITSSLGSIAVLCVQRVTGIASSGSSWSVVTALACLASWITGVVFGIVPVAHYWIKYDHAEMLCAVFWESTYSDMLTYILCAFSVTIFPPFLLILLCSLLFVAGYGRKCNNQDDLSSVAPLLVFFYLLCYSPFAASELLLLGKVDMSPSPEWLRTLASMMAYMNCGLNPLIYCTNQDFRQAALTLLWSRRQLSPSEPVLTNIRKLEA
ncbi:C5a anaphylatoxin chemotactic receptor 1 [Denticeps clupeoides]|uniref:C5a anaphylatoxin chemotactic receptor 1 n=1 Tax=Denticeps clupeoides TaxID=299321 RepID=UPI0010A44AF9|nr:C5a anaphylatoxin chemotactic receptor 1-like [Denticeps clupeoides]